MLLPITCRGAFERTHEARQREFHTSHMVDAFNPNSFTVPSVHNSAESVNEKGRGGGVAGKNMMSQLSEECVCVCCVCVCVHISGGPQSLCLLMARYPCRLNAKAVIKVE